MKPIVLTILDGWGYSPTTTGNAIANARKPTFDQIVVNYPSLLLQASGQAVGMTYGETGNSEVGHLALGSGRIITQYLPRIEKQIQSGDFFHNATLVAAAAHAQKNNTSLHFVGLLTSGSVHAYLNHIVALVHFAQKQQLPYHLHLFTDGRDSGQKEAPELLQKLSDQIGGLASLATIIGRDFAMDRDNHWNLTEAAYRLLVENMGAAASDPIVALTNYYKNGFTDSAIPATTLSPAPIGAGDSVVFFNFREDSMRQLIRVFTEPGFDTFLKKVPTDLYLAAMTKYLDSPDLHVIISPPDVPDCLSAVLSANNKKHLHIAETDKYAHVTFFFNGLNTKPFDGETDFFIESRADPLKQPEMRAMDIVQKVSAEMDRDYYDFFVLNLANGDILAHLGSLEVATQGVAAIDAAVGVLMQKVLAKDGTLIITADHGNVEGMIYKSTGEKETRHNDNPVPLYMIGRNWARPRTADELTQSVADPPGFLSDVAPTILELFGIAKPVVMTGSSLIKLLNN